MLRFALVGLAGLGVNLATFAGLLAYGAHPFLASAAAFEIAVVWNFLLNNYWTFGHRHMSSRRRARAIIFNAASLLTLGIKVLTYLLLSKTFPGGSPILHQAIAVVPGGLANYFINSRWTFRDQAGA